MTKRHALSASGALLLFLLFSSWRFDSMTADAQQTGVIAGRVVAEDGGGLSNVMVDLYPANTDQRNAGRLFTTTTGDDGNFKFMGVTPRAYSIYVYEARGYVNQPDTASGSNYYRIGDNVVITMIRGGVITGRVTNAEGEPMVGAHVSATKVRDSEGVPFRRHYTTRPRMTDDRGIYRLYGLTPGTYVVDARSLLSTQRISPYDGFMPTFHP